MTMTLSPGCRSALFAGLIGRGYRVGDDCELLQSIAFLVLHETKVDGRNRDMAGEAAVDAQTVAGHLLGKASVASARLAE